MQPYYDIILNKIPIESKRILDVGAGYGIFGYILKQTRKAEVDAIEPFHYDLLHYNEVHRKTWQEWIKNWDLNKYDVIISTEMIDHLSLQEAEEFLEEAKLVANLVIIATPFSFTRQENYDNNKYQIHKSLITKEMFKKHGYKIEILATVKMPRMNARIIYSKKLIPFVKLVKAVPTNIIAWWEKHE